MKKPFIFAFVAVVYIVTLVLAVSTFSSFIQNETILIPMAMLGLLVLSVAVMGFLFLYEPFKLYMENKKREAVLFFAKTVCVFAAFVLIFVILLFII